MLGVLAFTNDAAVSKEASHFFGILISCLLGVCPVVGLLHLQLVFKEIVSKCYSLTCFYNYRQENIFDTFFALV